MNMSGKTINDILKGGLAIILGYLALRIVNLPRTFILNLLFEGDLSEKGFPMTGSSQAVYLIYIFIAGLAGAVVVGLFSKQKNWTLLLIFGGLLLANDIYAIIAPLSEQPLWVKLLILLTLPLQIWIGGIIGMRFRMKDDNLQS